MFLGHISVIGDINVSMCWNVLTKMSNVRFVFTCGGECRGSAAEHVFTCQGVNRASVYMSN